MEGNAFLNAKLSMCACVCVCNAVATWGAFCFKYSEITFLDLKRFFSHPIKIISKIVLNQSRRSCNGIDFLSKTADSGNESQRFLSVSLYMKYI